MCKTMFLFSYVVKQVHYPKKSGSEDAMNVKQQLMFVPPARAGRHGWLARV